MGPDEMEKLEALIKSGGFSSALKSIGWADAEIAKSLKSVIEEATPPSCSIDIEEMERQRAVDDLRRKLGLDPELMKCVEDKEKVMMDALRTAELQSIPKTTLSYPEPQAGKLIIEGTKTFPEVTGHTEAIPEPTEYIEGGHTYTEIASEEDLSEIKRINYPSGAVKSVVRMLNGKRNGTYKQYHEHGDLQIYTRYVDNIKHGNYKEYYEDGTEKCNVIFDNGIIKGAVYFSEDDERKISYHKGHIFTVGKIGSLNVCPNCKREFITTSNTHVCEDFENPLEVFWDNEDDEYFDYGQKYLAVKDDRMFMQNKYGKWMFVRSGTIKD